MKALLDVFLITAVILCVMACAARPPKVAIPLAQSQQPTVASLEARMRALVQAAYEGDKKKVTSFFPGGSSVPWNRYAIGNLLQQSKPISPECRIVFCRVSGFSGYVEYYARTEEGMRDGQKEDEGAPMCWRWEGNDWYVMRYPEKCVNPDPDERARWERFVAEVDAEHYPCSDADRPEVERLTRQFLENIKTGHWGANVEFISKYEYYCDPGTSWDKDRYAEREAKHFGEVFADVKDDYSLIFEKRCTANAVITDYNPDDPTVLGKHHVAAVWFPIVKWTTTKGEKRSVGIRWVHEDGTWRIWCYP